MGLTPALIGEVAAYVDGWLAYRRRTLDIPGVQAAIAFRGEVLLDTGHGVTDVHTGAALTSRHLFRIASQSKTFTSTAILQLCEQGRLRLDDPLAAHLGWTAEVPACAPLARLTLAELLAHGGGVMRDGVDGDHWQLLNPYPDALALRALLGDNPVVFPANQRFHYSNLGYSLLGLVIEAVTGRSFGEHVGRSIIEPLRLLDTDVDLIESRVDDYAAGHTHNGNGATRIPIDHCPSNALAPAAGFTSTAADLCAFFTAHCDGDTRLLTDASKRRMRHVQWTQHEDEHYALGLQVWKLGDRTLIGHSGGHPGHITKTWCDPEAQVVVSVLTNAIDGPAAELCSGVMRLIDHVAKPAPGAAEHAPGVALERFTGRYVNLWGACDLAVIAGRLLLVWLEDNNPVGQVAELVAESDTRLRLVRTHDGYSNEGEAYTFDFAEDGSVARMRGDSAMSFWSQREYEHRLLGGGRVRPG